MLRQSEIDLVLDLEMEIGQRRRYGHFGLDASHVIGPQVRSSSLAHRNRNKEALSETSVKPFIEKVSSKGHVTYKRR